MTGVTRIPLLVTIISAGLVLKICNVFEILSSVAVETLPKIQNKL